MIHFLTQAPFYERDGKFTSDLASARYRIIKPAEHLSSVGKHVSIGPVLHDDVEVAVFGKCLDPSFVEMARLLSSSGKKAIVDVCDDYFAHAHYGSQYRQHYIDLCQAADVVVSSTARLAEAIKRESGVSAVVIGDPIEGPKGSPRFKPGPSIHALWYGHPSNWPSVQPMLKALEGFDVELTVVTHPVVQIVDDLRNSNLFFRFIPWSQAEVWKALARCDVVLIPSLPTDFYAAKSANRLTEALNAGRYVIANPVPSYECYQQWAWIGDIREGLEACRKDDGIEARLHAGQSAVRFESWETMCKWERVLCA